MTGASDGRSVTTDRDLVEELARIALDRTAPEELPLFEEVAGEFFADPDGLAAERREETLGFGIETALLAPYLLAAATPVITYLIATVSDAAKTEARPVIERWVRKLFRHGPAPAPRSDFELTAEHARRIRGLAIDRAQSLGLPRAQAELLADALVGSILISG